MNSGLALNMKCEIYYKEKIYKSHVQDISDKYIGISIPVIQGDYLVLQNKEIVDVTYYDDKNVYGFTTKVIGRKSEGITMLLLAPPKTVTKVQRRKFFRIDFATKVKLLKVENDIMAETFKRLSESSVGFEEGFLLDLSGGGLKIRLETKVKTGDIFIVKLPINETEISTLCRCVRSIKEYESESFSCGFVFSDISESVRETIISYIFQIMRKQTKRG